MLLPHGTSTLPQPSLHGAATPQPFSLIHLPSDPSLLTLKSDHHTRLSLPLALLSFQKLLLLNQRSYGFSTKTSAESKEISRVVERRCNN
ncbi:hypothetical protein OIU85_005514 [Salix viminalis]|uniref:Uncharacterized protein n=1 Tax=Salix viminalis TaxID=40686 RepID=A0A9Q0STS8_SALVM|nr:hypothetical protein OIU85_005514 [Salix viminalis]